MEIFFLQLFFVCLFFNDGLKNELSCLVCFGLHLGAILQSVFFCKYTKNVCLVVYSCLILMPRLRTLKLYISKHLVAII